MIKLNNREIESIFRIVYGFLLFERTGGLPGGKNK